MPKTTLSHSILVFYKICENYYVYITENVFDGEIIHFIPPKDSSQKNLTHNDVPDFVHKILNARSYVVMVRAKSISFYEDKILSIPKITNHKIDKIIAIEEFFRRATKEELINSLFSHGNGIENALAVITEYCFCQYYALWSYNKYTDHYTLVASSFKEPNYTYFDAQRGDHKVKRLFNKANLGGQYFESYDKNFATELNKTYSASILKFELSPEAYENKRVFVLFLYSKCLKYALRENTALNIIEILKHKISNDYLLHFQSWRNIQRKIQKQYSPGKINQFFNKICVIISKDLGWETSSIFIQKGQELVASGTNDSEGTIANDIPPYPINEKSLTANLFSDRSQTIAYSYSIFDDERNSGIHIEKTKNDEGKCWIGVVIQCNKKRYGILRVKNKYRNNKACFFNCIDIETLQSVCDIIGYCYKNEQEYRDKLRKANEDYQKQIKKANLIDTSLRTLRHEIRAPIQYLNQAKLLFEDALHEDGSSWSDIENLVNTQKIINNFLVMTNRLRFVSLAYTFEPEKLVRNVGTHRLYDDVAEDILNFAKKFGSWRRKYLDIDISSIKALPPAICDPIAAALAFNILVDNAIKYAPEESRISIWGEEHEECCSLVVENNGSPILPEEETEIFSLYSRGEHAQDQNIEGDGIGLFLCAALMSNMEGQVKLESPDSPIIFRILFKKRIAYENFND